MGEFGAKFLSDDPFKRSVNDNWDLFKEDIVNSMKKNIPQKKVSSRWNLPWMTSEIKSFCRKKKRAWDAGKRHRNSHAWKRYQKLSKLVKECLENSHRTYVDNILITSINEDHKKFCSYIKQKKSGQSTIPVLKTNGKLVSEPAEVAEALNSKYISQFTREPTTGDLPNIDGKSVPSMSDIIFTVPGIVKHLSNLNPSQSLRSRSCIHKDPQAGINGAPFYFVHHLPAVIQHWPRSSRLETSQCYSCL